MMNNGIVPGDLSESTAQRVSGLSGMGPFWSGDGRGTGPGILIYSRSRKLLHMNRRVMELTGHLDRTDTEPTMRMPSASVHELRQKMQVRAGLSCIDQFASSFFAIMKRGWAPEESQWKVEQ